MFNAAVNFIYFLSFMLLFVCRNNVTGMGMAEGFNGNPKDVSSAKSFHLGLARSASSEFNYFLLYLFRELPNDV
jgi:hypothetical protein